MSADITELGWTARRLDVSSTFRAFAAPVTIATTWALFAGDVYLYLFHHDDWQYSVENWIGVALHIVTLLSAILSPLSFILADIMARANLRGISGAIGFAMGWLGQLGLVAVAAGAALLAVVGPMRGMLFESAKMSLSELTWAQALVAALVVLLVALTVWAIVRAVRIEYTLAGPAPRRVIVGDVEGGGLFSRFALVLGLPSSMWRAGALLMPSFWLFVLSRPLLYGGLSAFAASSKGADQSDQNPFADSMAPPEPPANPVAALLGVDPGTAMIIVVAVLIVASHLVFIAAKRLASRRIWNESDTKPPILFLRSFTDDRLDFKRPRLDLVGRWLDLWSFRGNADELLIDEFGQYGPVVALGRPGQKQVPFGAQRRFTSNEEWQQVIAETAKGARAIIVAAGETPGLAWEYELLSREDLLSKTILLIPPGDGASTARRLEILTAAFPTLDFARAGKLQPIAVTFASGDPRALVAKHPTAEAYLVALRAFMQGRSL